MPKVSASEAATGAKNLINQRYMNPSRLWGLDWGFEGLNDITGGIQFANPSWYTVVAARSNVGKSAFGMTVALTQAFQFMQKYKDKEVRIILLEMDAITCELRLASQLTGVPLVDIYRGEITPDQKARLESAVDHLGTLPLVFAEGSYTMDYIVEFVSRKNNDTDRTCGFWLLDHIGIVPTSAAAGANQAFSLGEMSRRFQALCRKHAPGMVLAQLNRETMKNKDGKPNVKDVYGSDRILQDCDFMLLLDRPETRQQLSEEEKRERQRDLKPEVATLIIGKNRNGALGEIPVLFHPRRALWSDVPKTVQKVKAVA